MCRVLYRINVGISVIMCGWVGSTKIERELLISPLPSVMQRSLHSNVLSVCSLPVAVRWAHHD